MPVAAEPVAAAPLREERHGAVLRIVMQDVARRNLLTEAMMAALSDALARAAADTAVRVVVIAAEGPAFSVGHDLKTMDARAADPDGGAAYYGALFATCSALMEGIARNPRPVIAEVASVAVAAGCQLVAASDLAVAAETARFGTTGVTYGLFCSTPMVPLSRTVNGKDALEMLLTGDLVDAAHAHRIGLVNRVVPPERLTEETMALAARIAEKSPAVVSLGKRAYYRQVEMGLAEAYRFASDKMVENLMLADGKEGIAAFAGKRPAVWSGR